MAKTEIVKRHKSVRTRPKGFVLRLTAEELEELRAAADAAVLPLTTWARTVILNVARAARKSQKPIRGNVPMRVERTHRVRRSPPEALSVSQSGRASRRAA